MIVGCLAENWNEWVSESENLAHVGTCLKCLELVILTLEKCIFYGFILFVLWCDSSLEVHNIRGGPLCYPQCCSSGRVHLTLWQAGAPNYLLRHTHLLAVHASKLVFSYVACFYLFLWWIIGIYSMLVQLCYMNNHMCTGCRPNSTCKSLDPEYRHQALAGPLVQMSGKTDHVRVTTKERLD
jgi:hypothetical protein